MEPQTSHEDEVNESDIKVTPENVKRSKFIKDYKEIIISEIFIQKLAQIF